MIIIKNFKAIFIFICIIYIIFLSIFISLINHTENLSLSTEKVTSFNKNWTSYSSDGTTKLVTLPASLDAKMNEDVVIKNTFPTSLPNNTTFCIRNSQQSIKVIVDGEIIYSRGLDSENNIGKSFPSTWNLIHIPDKFKGKEFSLVLNSPNNIDPGIVNEIFYGSESAVLFHLIFTYGFGFAVAILILLIGIVLLIVSMFMIIYKTDFWGFLYLSLFAILISLWLIGESRMLQFVTGNQFIIANLSYLALLLLPIPYIYYISSICKFHEKNFLNLLSVICYCNFFVSCVLNYLNIYELVIVINLLILVTSFYIIYLLLREFLKYKNKIAKQILMSFIVLAIEIIAEQYTYYFSDYSYISKYLRTGILLYILISLSLSFSRVKNISKISQERKYYKKLAFMDLLTSGNNRTAYYKDVENLINDEQVEIFVAQFDVNGLKEINDTYGHINGDKAIKDAYDCIQSAFGEIGTCYRIGGDEFTCIIKNANYEQIEKAIYSLQEKTSQYNSERIYHFSIAVGVSQYDKESDESFEMACSRADEIMYQHKNSSKQINF